MLDYMKSHKYVTRLTAMSKIGIANPMEIIRQLKEQGNVIGDEWVSKTDRYGDKTKYKRYWLIKEAS